MRDQRVPLIRRALDGLLDSLEATLRMSGWAGPEEVPEPLRASAGRLIERLGFADRFAGISVRDERDAKSVEAMRTAIRRLDAAYVAFHQAVERAPASGALAGAALQQEIDNVKEGNDAWAPR